MALPDWWDDYRRDCPWILFVEKVEARHPTSSLLPLPLALCRALLSESEIVIETLNDFCWHSFPDDEIASPSFCWVQETWMRSCCGWRSSSVAAFLYHPFRVVTQTFSPRASSSSHGYPNVIETRIRSCYDVVSIHHCRPSSP